MAGIGLAGATLFRDQKKAQQRVDLDQRLVVFHKALTNTLTQTQNCNATLKNFYNSSIPSSATQGIYSCATGCSTSDLETDADDVGRSSELYTNTPERFIDDTRTWRIENVSIPGPATKTTTGTLVLRISYGMNPSIGTQKVAKDIILNVRFFGGAFKECFDPQESSVNNLQNDLCRTATVASSGTNRIAIWNPVTQKCEFQTSVRPTCPTGEIVEGVRSDGTVLCRSMTSGFVPSGNDQSTTTSCPAGKTATLQWDNVAKKMSVQCL